MKYYVLKNDKTLPFLVTLIFYFLAKTFFITHLPYYFCVNVMKSELCMIIYIWEAKVLCNISDCAIALQ